MDFRKTIWKFILSEEEFSFSQEADMGKEIFCQKQRVFLSVTFLSPLLLWTSDPVPVLSGSLTADNYKIRFSHTEMSNYKYLISYFKRFSP